MVGEHCEVYVRITIILLPRMSNVAHTYDQSSSGLWLANTVRCMFVQSYSEYKPHWGFIGYTRNKFEPSLETDLVEWFW